MTSTVRVKAFNILLTYFSLGLSLSPTNIKISSCSSSRSNHQREWFVTWPWPWIMWPCACLWFMRWQMRGSGSKIRDPETLADWRSNTKVWHCLSVYSKWRQYQGSLLLWNISDHQPPNTDHPQLVWSGSEVKNRRDWYPCHVFTSCLGFKLTVSSLESSGLSYPIPISVVVWNFICKTWNYTWAIYCTTYNNLSKLFFFFIRNSV